jgi:hypothetical protein
LVEKAVEETFKALFALTDLRQIFRDSKPTYEFNVEQKEEIRKIVEQVKRSIEIIEGELLK